MRRPIPPPPPPRFEIVHTGPRRFHGRFIASNGEIVWWTESYSRRIDACRAMDMLRLAFARGIQIPQPYSRSEVIDERSP